MAMPGNVVAEWLLEEVRMTVDSFRWIPPSLTAWLKETWILPDERGSVPFARLKKPLSEARLAVLTTGGLYVRGEQEPFDMERERADPDWGDPSHRVIPSDTQPGKIAVSHGHYNPADVESDHNVLFPLQRLVELRDSGAIGSIAPSAYSVMGYQGHPGPNWGPWREETGPAILAQMQAEGVEGALLTPA